MASKKGRMPTTRTRQLVKIAPGVYSDDPRDLKEARQWARREESGRRKKSE
jgi:hypothetical protein